MKKDLPGVFANPLNKDFKNVQEIYYSKNDLTLRNSSVSIDSILTKINRIFNSSHHVYKSKVKITTNNGILVKEIVGKSSGNLLTLDGEVIKIIDILDIEKM
ncbi:MAG: hypothetical protein IJN03_00155 [Bacilli bacterium]|nr:hypothetical protein [Bacilli bacterium]